MTWTVFEHQVGRNETDDDAPGRGGYKYVLVPLDAESATAWWTKEYGEDPSRPPSYPEYGVDDHTWTAAQVDEPDDVRAQCGVVEVDGGGIGVPKTRLYTWNELRGRLDVRVVTAADI
jgi:hypothetical protein